MNENTSVPDWLLTSATALESFLNSHPDAEHQAREILDKRLSKTDANTWNTLISSLDNYWGKESTDIVINVAQQPDAEKRSRRLEEINKFASPAVMNFLRKIYSLYDLELANTFLVSNQLPNGWQTFYRDVYPDPLNKRSFIRIRLAKYNGEEPFIEGNADSILELTMLMVKTMRSLESPVLFGKNLAEQFIQDANDFIQFLQPLIAEAPEDQSTNQSATLADEQKK
jgi:hypothetical protein